MLVEPGSWSLAYRIEDVLTAAGDDFGESLNAETHGSAVELQTGVHPGVNGAVTELRGLREELVGTLEPLGMRAAGSGTHPTATWRDVVVSRGERYRDVYASMRELARREPTFALHVHVGRRRSRDRDPGHERDARLAAPAPRPVGELAVLAGARQRPRVGPDAGLPGLPARGHPAGVQRLRRLRRGRGHADPHRRDPRADLPVVGRAPAARARHGRGADHGRPDEPVADARPGGAGPVPVQARGRGRPQLAAAPSTRPRPSRRTASSPAATASRRA